MIAFDSLASYERYRGRLKSDKEARENFTTAQAKRFILREERNFAEVVDETFGIPPSLARGGVKPVPTQAEKARAFRALHERPGAFIIPNPGDIGSARILAHLGFQALATTSMGYAFSLGRPDNTLNRAETLAYASAIVSATSLPVSAHLENGFGDDSKVVAETIRLAAAIGLVGGSIEDAAGCPDDPIYEIEHAVERIQAATDTARALPFLSH